MLEWQQATFESMAVSNAFDSEGIGKQDSVWTMWYLTPRVFEKEAEDEALQEAQQKSLHEVERKAKQESREKIAGQETSQAVTQENKSGESLNEKRSAWL